MKTSWVVAFAMLLLTGCTTTSIDQAIQKNLPAICRNATTTHLAFTAVTAITDKVPDRYVRSEQVAYSTVIRLCDDPASVDSATVLVAATTAYLEMTKALKAAKAVEVTVVATK